MLNNYTKTPFLLFALLLSACDQEISATDLNSVSIDVQEPNHGISCMNEEVFMSAGSAIEEAAASDLFETSEFDSQEGWQGYHLRFVSQSDYWDHVTCVYKGKVSGSPVDDIIPIYRGYWAVELNLQSQPVNIVYFEIP